MFKCLDTSQIDWSEEVRKEFVEPILMDCTVQLIHQNKQADHKKKEK